MLVRIAVLLAALGTAFGTACGADSTSGGDGAAAAKPEFPPPPAAEGFQLKLDAVAPAASEIWICDVYQLPGTEPVNVSWVETRQNHGTHHLTLSTLGSTGDPPVPYGRYDCNDLYGDRSLMEDQIMFYGDQGSAQNIMRLPDGVAATLPGGLDVIHEVHYVNTTEQDVELYSWINAWTVPGADVDNGIWGGSVRDEHINIPASGQHTEWSRCVMTHDVQVLFLASHTHQRGVRFTIAPYDSEAGEVGEVFYDNDDWHIPLITQYEPARTVNKGQGFQWSCTWDNPTNQPIEYGLDATDEMCNLAVVFTPFLPQALCEVTETSDGVLYTP